MNCCIDELCNKDVINIENGSRMGYVCDVEVDMSSGHISTLLISCSARGISFKKPESIRICWEDIVVMGEETILVKNVSGNAPVVKSNKGIFDIFSK